MIYKMKNGKYERFKRNENIMHNLKIKKNLKITFWYLVVICLVMKNLPNAKAIELYGFGVCIINLKGGSKMNLPDNCKSINNDTNLNCTLSSTLTEINLNSALNSTSYMFKDCKTLTSIHLTSIDSLRETNGMFENCINLKSITFGNFDTSKVVNMSHMFYNCSSLEQLQFDNNYFQT